MDYTSPTKLSGILSDLSNDQFFFFFQKDSLGFRFLFSFCYLRESIDSPFVKKLFTVSQLSCIKSFFYFPFTILKYLSIAKLRILIYFCQYSAHNKIIKMSQCSIKNRFCLSFIYLVCFRTNYFCFISLFLIITFSRQLFYFIVSEDVNRIFDGLGVTETIS